MKQTLILFMQDEPGVLNRIASLVRRRNFNIDSIVAGRTEKNGITRMTLVVDEPNREKRRIIYNNLKKLVDVYDVVDATDENCHVREHALVKVSIKPNEFKEIEGLVAKGNCRILDGELDSMILELSGNESTVEESIKYLKKFKILELLRSGKMAMISGNQDKNNPVLIRSEPK
jgi:acetolactate synthase-1/3 small subunit|tara:strand:- start:302 stop:823 length:522 start_codon:yes stop_codon:yes gene_type:complete